MNWHTCQTSDLFYPSLWTTPYSKLHHSPITQYCVCLLLRKVKTCMQKTVVNFINSNFEHITRETLGVVGILIEIILPVAGEASELSLVGFFDEERRILTTTKVHTT